jgi:hypothetical protein
MPMQEYRRSKGQRLLYTIEYDQAKYFIERDGLMKRAVPDAIVSGIMPGEASPDLMLRTAIADIETLYGMDE